MKKAVFLDRDGTLIEEKKYLHRPEEVEIFPGTAAALCALQQAGYSLFIVSNQAGVGRGYFGLEAVAAVNARLVNELAGSGVHFEKIYIAPEAPGQPNHGRKPSPQFLHDARDEFGIDLAQSYMIGDKMIDLECGWNAGVRKSILVRTGYGKEVEQSADSRVANALTVNSLPQAVEWILQQTR